MAADFSSNQLNKHFTTLIAQQGPMNFCAKDIQFQVWLDAAFPSLTTN
jgi:hypothetical protein